MIKMVSSIGLPFQSAYHFYVLILFIGSSPNGDNATTAAPISTTAISSTLTSINKLITNPCGNGMIQTTTPSTCANNFTVDDFERVYGVTERLKRYVNKLNKSYRKKHSSTCNNPEKMNLESENLKSYCLLPKPMSSRNANELPKNLMLITKWLFWVKEAEYHIAKTYVLRHLSSADIRLSSYITANFSKASLCAIKGRLCFPQSDIDDATNCGMPAIEGVSDPEGLVPPSCYILGQINKFVNKLYRPLCSLNGHSGLCKRKRAIKNGKRKGKKGRKDRCKGKKAKKNRCKGKKARKNRGKKGNKGSKTRRQKNKNRKNKTKGNKNRKESQQKSKI